MKAFWPDSPPDVMAALQEAIDLLDRYQEGTDASKAYRILQTAIESVDVRWEARVLLAAWSGTPWAQTHSYELYKRTQQFLPRLDADIAADRSIK